jgi:adenine-specific DNA-methyltransferase
MPTTQQLRQRLLNKLNELFQLDQPDLDFSFYRIMHAKAREVQDFINNDLLHIVSEAFNDREETNNAELKARIDREIEIAKEYGVSDPENSPKVKEARDAYNAAQSTAGAEAEVYDHLYRFFERYYEDGDFISRRYYTRETSGRAAPFAIPYNGEEVKLHWANADQYYVKSAEYFSNFSFDLRQAKEVQALRNQDNTGVLPGLAVEIRRKVHFRIVEATEGEHGNIKASEANKRFFIIHKHKPVELNESGELVCNFEYRPDPEKTGQEGAWREKRNAEAVDTILQALEGTELLAMENDGDDKATQEIRANQDSIAHEYVRLLKVPAPTAKDKHRPLLAKYINQYTARNTMDYFIHKDLCGFLRRELDFYIKNEVMHLDDIENADAPAVDSYLKKIKVLRTIAAKLIDFLAQIEDFQKKLWLKKKFVVETNYCLTLDRVPEDLYPDISSNESQIAEWRELFAIDEIEGFSRPLTTEFLQANDKLLLDTRFFDPDFTARLVASIENFDEQCDGVLVHSENFQALNLLQNRYQEQVKCVYIDPPYNTGKDGFPYKDSYEHSSWIAMIFERIESAISLIKENGAFFISIDEKEHHNLLTVSNKLFGAENFLADFVWIAEGNFDNQAKIKIAHEYIVSYAKKEQQFGLPPVIDPSIRDNSKLFRDEIRNTIVKNGPKNPISKMSIPAGFPADFQQGIVNNYDIEWPKYNSNIFIENYKLKNPVIAESGWSSKALCESFIQNNMQDVLDSKGQLTSFVITKTGAIESIKKRSHQQSYVTSIIKGVGTIQSTRSMLNNMRCPYPHYPKPPNLISYIASMIDQENLIVLDYFAGSGTTSHAVINLNRNDNGKRKYILIEMGDYFDTVLKPRIAKAVYSEHWKEGKPMTRDGMTQCFKYLRLESYEDTLNNLSFNHAPSNSPLMTNASLREDYMLRYLLDVETRGSQSLLNIDAFTDPTAYTLNIKKPGANEYRTQAVDLIETFNYLMGLRVVHISAPQCFTAEFKRSFDPELPTDQRTRLAVDGDIHKDPEGPWWFRKVQGWLPADPANPNNGQRENVLIIWRKLTGDLEKDNVMLNAWFQKIRPSSRDFKLHTIYVNGSSNLPSLKNKKEKWQVRLIEEEFMKRMWEVEG